MPYHAIMYNLFHLWFGYTVNNNSIVLNICAYTYL